jgi:hypothetical protein
VADLLLAELVDVWLLEEDFADIICSLAARGIIAAETKIVPCGYEFDIAFGSVDWGARYPEIPWPHYEWPYYDTGNWARAEFSPVMEFKRVHSVNSAELYRSERHFVAVRLEVSRADAETLERVNAVRLSGTLILWSGITIGRCGSMNAPILIPIRTARAQEWCEGIRVTARLSGGIRSLRIAAGQKTLLGNAQP